MKTRKKVLVTGAVSLLGKYIVEELNPSYELFIFAHQHKFSYRMPKGHIFHVNIANKKEIQNALSTIRPEIVIHLAALSNIDYCQSHQSEARKINVKGTEYIIEALEKSRTLLVFASSNAVFSGNKPPYRPTDTPNPLNFYGKTKFQSEQLIQKHLPHYAIIRFTSIYGWPPFGARSNDLPYYLEQLKKRKKLFLVNDRFFNPVSAHTAALAIKQIIKKKKSGIYHVAGKNRISRYTYVTLIKKLFVPHSSCELIPVTSDFFPHLSPRPADASLDATVMKKLGIPLRPIDVELIAMNAAKTPQ